MKVRPKSHTTIFVPSLCGTECIIECYPEQIWDACESEFHEDMVELSRKNVTVIIPRRSFEKYWKKLK